MTSRKQKQGQPLLWETATRRRVEAVFGRDAHNGRPQSPQDLPQVMVDLVNGVRQPDWRDRTDKRQHSDARWRARMDAERNLARAMLEAAAHSHAELVAFLLRQPRLVQMGHVRQIPHLEIAGDQFVLDWRMWGPADARPWILLTGALLASSSAVGIGRCRLAECARFFVIHRPPGRSGRLRTEYCSRDHQEAQHKKENASRQKVRRQRLASEGAKRGRRQK